jgi:hypothetical protein
MIQKILSLSANVKSINNSIAKFVCNPFSIYNEKVITSQMYFNWIMLCFSAAGNNFWAISLNCVYFPV